jgi:hypothetical protein
MILYHFTDFWFLINGGTIMKEGLKPGLEPKDLIAPALFAPAGAVWFTTEADPASWWESGKGSECRITAVIPFTDRSLVSWEKWARKHFAEDELDSAFNEVRSRKVNYKSWYIYFGEVSRSKLRKIEYADPQRRAA